MSSETIKFLKENKEKSLSVLRKINVSKILNKNINLKRKRKPDKLDLIKIKTVHQKTQ